MKRLAAVLLASLTLAGCRQSPTGVEFYDRSFVRNYAEIVEFWDIYGQARSVLFPGCDTTSINSMVPDPYWRFNRAHRLEAQQVRAQAAAAGMADAGMTPPPQPASGANIDCLPPTKLTDDQMVMEMDRRLNKHLRIVQRMEAISAVVLDD